MPRIQIRRLGRSNEALRSFRFAGGDPFIRKPEMFNTLPPLEDQQLGAVLMKIIQEAVYGTYLAVIFFQWVRTEREKDTLSEPPYIEHTVS